MADTARPQRLNSAAKFGSALADQATIAGSHFVFQMIVARYASVDEYAAFAVAYTGVTLAAAVHAGFVAEPVLVHVGAVERKRRDAYLSSVLRLNARASAALAGLAALVGAGSILFGARDAGAVLIAAAIAIPAILLQRLVRMIAYGVGSPASALHSSSIYAVLSIALAIVLGAAGLMTGWAAFVPLGVGGLLGSVAIIRHKPAAGSDGPSTSLYSEVKTMHLSIGTWSAGAQVMSWVPWNAFLLVVAAFQPSEDVANFRVALTLFLPALHVMWALGPVLVPRFAAGMRSGKSMRSTLTMPVVTALGGSFVFSAALLLSSEWVILHTFGAKYLPAAELAVGLAALPVIAGAAVVLEAYYRAARMQRWVFYSRVGGVVIGLLASVPLVFTAGVSGAIIAQFLTLLIGMTLLVWRRASVADAARAL